MLPLLISHNVFITVCDICLTQNKQFFSNSMAWTSSR